MRRKILAVSLVLVMALAFTACGGEALPTAQEIVDGTIQALDDIRTYEFEMTMSTDVTGEAEGEAFEGTLAADFGGTLDRENMRMRMDVAISAAVTGEDEADLEMETYFIGDTLYMGTNTPDSEPAWIKIEMPTGYWEQIDQIEPYIEILEASQVEVIGSEKVGDVDCYVLQLIPDAEQLWQTLTKQLATTMGMTPDFDEEFNERVFHSYSAKQWISKDSYFLMKVEVEIEETTTGTNPEAPDETAVATTNMVMTLLAYNYNQPVSIELPPEAEEAIEVPMLGS